MDFSSFSVFPFTRLTERERGKEGEREREREREKERECQPYPFPFKKNTDKETVKNSVRGWWGDSSLPQLKGYLIQSCAEFPDLFLVS